MKGALFQAPYLHNISRMLSLCANACVYLLTCITIVVVCQSCVYLFSCNTVVVVCQTFVCLQFNLKVVHDRNDLNLLSNILDDCSK